MEAGVALRLAHWADGRRKEAEARLKDLQVPSPVSLAKSLCPLELGERGRREVQRCSGCPRGLHCSKDERRTARSTHAARRRRGSVRQRRTTGQGSAPIRKASQLRRGWAALSMANRRAEQATAS